jgi:exopolysaccharide production protein ExoZ
LATQDPPRAHRFGRYRTLELGRGVAAFVVVLRHACVHAIEGPNPGTVIPLPSATAVMFFFMLSGCVMTMTTPPAAGAPGDAARFIGRRLLRLYPAYWVVLGITLWMWPSLAQDHAAVWNWLLLVPRPLPYPSLIGLMIVPQAWTLLWEVFFYAAFATSMIVGRHWLLGAWVGLIVLRSVAVVPVLDHGLPGLFSDQLGLLFIGGVAIGEAEMRGWFAAWPPRVVLGAGAALTGVSMWQGSWGLWLPNGLAQTLVATAGLGCVILAVMRMEDAGRVRPGRLAMVAGEVSYPLYIVHWLAMDLVFSAFVRAGLNPATIPIEHAAVLVLASVAAAFALLRLVDLPARLAVSRLLRR